MLGAVVSTVKDVTESVFPFLPELSVTYNLQLLKVPSESVVKSIVVLPAFADVVELLQLPT